ncbi:MAG TPA: hypothetical protein VE487_02850 [Ilumatobacter sp.]|nr:hypothetical protein [Ilumatobacter sp.]
MNQVKNRLQALGLLDRCFAATTDEELTAAVEALDDDHRDALAEVLKGEPSPDEIRAAVARGRLDGTLEGITLVLTDATLADCIEQLGDHAENPTSDELREILPGIVERHGLALTRMMLASTVVGEAPASAIIRDLLKHDELVQLPPAEPRPMAPMYVAEVDPDERAAIKAKRKEMHERKQAAARASREQAAKARHRT